jgi:MFS family permease
MTTAERFLSAFSSGLLFFFVIFQMTLFSSLNDVLLQHYSLSQVKLGWVSSVYFYAAAISLIPLGLLLDYAAKRSITIFLAFGFVVINSLFSLHPSLSTICIYRFYCGLMNSYVFLLCMRQAAIWFPKKLSLAISLLITLGMLGGLMPPIVNLSLAATSLATTLLLNTLLSLIIAILITAFIVEKPATNFPALKTIFGHLHQSIRDMETWFCGVFTGILNLPVTVLGAFWGVFYLTHHYHMTEAQATIINSMIFFGMIIASPLIGYFSERIRSRRIPMILGSFLMLIASALLYVHHFSFALLAIMFFIIGFLGTTQIIAFSVITERHALHRASTALSLVSVIMYLCGAVVNPLFGMLVKKQSLIGTPHIPVFFTLCFLIAFIISLLIKESYVENIVKPCKQELQGLKTLLPYKQ